MSDRKPAKSALDPVFGYQLRALRYGYHYAAGYGMLRIDACGPPWIVSICPVGILPPQPRSGSHVVWWEGDADSVLILRTIRQALEGRACPLTEYTELELDDAGKVVNPVTRT